MIDNLLRAMDYSDRGTSAVFKVLIELAQVLGSKNNKFVVVGGIVPSLLYADAVPKHIGTLDIDLNLNTEALGDYDYADLVEELENHGYVRDADHLKAFQLERIIDIGDGGDPIPVLVDLLRPNGIEVKKHSKKLVPGLHVQKIDGGIYALNHCTEVKLDGEMPDGRRNLVSIFIAKPSALMVMKGYAIADRDKMKDAYDIWFCIRNHTGGVEALAEECRPLLVEEEAKKAFENIAEKFRDIDDFGPATVRKFVEGSEALGDMTPEQIQTDAFMQVKRWCELLGLNNG